MSVNVTISKDEVLLEDFLSNDVLTSNQDIWKTRYDQLVDKYSEIEKENFILTNKLE